MTFFRYGRLTAVVTAAIILTAACSNGEESATVSTENSVIKTNLKLTTTTVKSVASTGSDSDESAEVGEAEPQAEGDFAPFTGLPVSDEVDLDRLPLVAKIDNHPRARPQAGLDLADVVFEMRAEGVTRFAALFHSYTPASVGPVRSSRTSDFDLLKGLGNPLYASSGGNDNVAAGLKSLPIVAVTNLTHSEYHRDSSRSQPHNLYIKAGELFAYDPGDFPPPVGWFDYRGDGDELPESARRVEGPVTVRYTGGPVVTYTWGSERAGWLRTQDGRPHKTSGGGQLAPENVVVMVADYQPSSADNRSPELVSVGEGRLFVLTDGHFIEGVWTRPDAAAAPKLVDLEGQSVALTPGRTWVLYPEAGQVVVPF